jgi:molybdopterin-biosynthesis enzyme MoeA-like protein
MARIPDGASLIANPVSAAPGFQIGNVFVLAGVPSIMNGMLQDIGHRIAGGAVVESHTLACPGLREGDIAAALGELATAMPDVSLGSYPWYDADGFGVNLVARSTDQARLAEAASRLAALVEQRRAD